MKHNLPLRSPDVKLQDKLKDIFAVENIDSAMQQVDSTKAIIHRPTEIPEHAGIGNFHIVENSSEHRRYV